MILAGKTVKTIKFIGDICERCVYVSPYNLFKKGQPPGGHKIQLQREQESEFERSDDFSVNKFFQAPKKDCL